jgi:polyferredoxin
MPALRWLVQLAFLGLTALVAYEFAVFYADALGGGPTVAPRPAGVEAFLPLSALLALGRLLETGAWDFVHPAGLTFLIAAIAGAAIARRAFCSWVCPFGLAGRILEAVRVRAFRLPPRWRLPTWTRWPFLVPKYLLLGFFVWTIGSMPLEGIEGFLRAPYNLAADAHMWRFLVHPSGLALLVIAALVVLSILARHAWCRFLCPYGALLGLAALLSPFRISRNPDACVDCGACARACPSGIPVDRRRSVVTAECTSCLSCVAACQVKDALDVRAVGGRRVRAWALPAIALGILLFAYGATVGTRYWNTSLSPADFAAAYRAGPPQR